MCGFFCESWRMDMGDDKMKSVRAQLNTDEGMDSEEFVEFLETFNFAPFDPVMEISKIVAIGGVKLGPNADGSWLLYGGDFGTLPWGRRQG